MLTACIKDIAYYLPENVLTNDELAKEYPDWSPNDIYKKVGICQRHICSPDETAVDLAIQAVQKLFKKNNGLKQKVDFLILCTQSPDYILPTSACIIQDKLGLTQDCGAFDYNLGCSGFVYGLAIAKGLISARIARNIILIMAETYSKHIHPKDKSTRTIFGDAAAAIWINESENNGHINEFVFGSDGSGAGNLIIPEGGMRIRNTHTKKTEYSDENGNIRTDTHLFMNGPEIFIFTLKIVPRIVSALLVKTNYNKDDIDYYIFHQANIYILEHLRKKLNISEDKFYMDLKDTGNTVSASIPLALQKLIEKKAIKKGDKIMLVGFGVGYSWGACLIEL